MSAKITHNTHLGQQVRRVIPFDTAAPRVNSEREAKDYFAPCAWGTDSHCSDAGSSTLCTYIIIKAHLEFNFKVSNTWDQVGVRGKGSVSLAHGTTYVSPPHSHNYLVLHSLAFSTVLSASLSLLS